MSGSASPARKLFHLLPNGAFHQRPDPVRYRSSGSLFQLLSDASSILKLHGPAKQAYTQDGKPVKSLESLPTNTTLIISCGEPFAQPANPSVLKERLQKTVSSPIQSSPTRSVRIETDFGSRPSLSALSTRSEMTAITVSAQPRSRYARYHQLLVVLPGSFEDQIRESLLASYLALDDEGKAVVDSGEVYAGMVKGRQMHLFLEQLVAEGICGRYSASPLDDFVEDWAIALFNEVPIEEIRMLVGGPRLSGKTFLLGAASQILYRFLQNSEEVSNYLMFPFNCGHHTRAFSDPVLLYSIVITILFNSIRYTRFEFLPFWLPLREWFLCAPTIGTIGKLPSNLMEYDGIDSEAMAKLATQIHAAFHRGTDDLLPLIFNLPNMLATALKMKSGVFLIDGLESAPGDVVRAFAVAVRTVPFIVASRITREFKPRNTRELSTVDLVNSDYANVLALPDIGVRLTVREMLGCPGFVCAFMRICEMLVRRREQQVPGHGAGAPIASKVDAARGEEADHELRELLVALVDAGSDVVTRKMLAALHTGAINVKLVAARS